jgi:hypothetical protein
MPPLKPTFPMFMPIDHPLRRQPAEFIQGQGWKQGPHRRRKVKPFKHFIWPKDGRNGSTWGRMKDILQSKGPDIHVAFSADKRDYMSNRPSRARWSRHSNLDDRDRDSALKYELPWVGRRGTDKCYDFRTRTFVSPYKNMWTDALWSEEPNNDYAYPYATRDYRGEWSQYCMDPFFTSPEGMDPNFPPVWLGFWGQ